VGFGNNAFVYMGACSSFSDDSLLLRLEFFNKNASHYAGWDCTVGSLEDNKALVYIVHRMLGKSTKTSIFNIGPENPKQRPFDLLAVYNEMKRKGYATSDFKQDGIRYVAELKIDSIHQDLDQGFGIFLPTIKKMTVDEEKQELSIEGIFGTDGVEKAEARRKVKLNGEALDIIQWDKDIIRCKLPPSGGGDVIVWVDDRKSNTVQLTEWKTKFKLEWMEADPEGSAQGNIIFYCNFRADVHDYRNEVDRPPIKPTQVPFFAERSSYATFEENGTRSFGPLGEANTFGSGIIDNVVRIPGLEQPEPADSSFLICQGTMDMENSRLTIYLHAYQKDGVTVTSQWGAEEADMDTPVIYADATGSFPWGNFGSNVFPDETLGNPGVFEIKDYSFTPKTWMVTNYPLFCFFYSPCTSRISLTLESTTVTSLPDSDAAR
jgi:hypothetical protein